MSGDEIFKYIKLLILHSMVEDGVDCGVGYQT
jgi:hypothetical protein